MRIHCFPNRSSIVLLVLTIAMTACAPTDQGPVAAPATQAPVAAAAQAPGGWSVWNVRK